MLTHVMTSQFFIIPRSIFWEIFSQSREFRKEATEALNFVSFGKSVYNINSFDSWHLRWREETRKDSEHLH